MTNNGNVENQGFLLKLKQGLTKTRKGFVRNLNEMVFGEKVISKDTFEEIEEILITADIGPTFTYNLIEEMKNKAKRKELTSPAALKKLIQDNMINILKKSEKPLAIPRNELYTIMVIGVNGTGKTTTIGKLAHCYKKQGIPVMLVAADTFRAAAIEQLEIWSQKVDVPIIKQKMGADPSAIVYDAVHAAQTKNINVMVIDTAGRLHTKVNLMEELKKVKRIMGRELEGSPHETLLVLDATTGQNAILQAKMFNEAIGVTGIVLTKLDGTAKGGIVIRIAQELNIPIRYIGIGEDLDDLRTFNSSDFVTALLE